MYSCAKTSAKGCTEVEPATTTLLALRPQPVRRVKEKRERNRQKMNEKRKNSRDFASDFLIFWLLNI
jgi:hypothetical protein